MSLFSAPAALSHTGSQTALKAAATRDSLVQSAHDNPNVGDDLWVSWYTGPKPVLALATAKALAANMSDSRVRLAHLLLVEKRAVVLAAAIANWRILDTPFPTEALDAVLDLPKGASTVVAAVANAGQLDAMPLGWVTRAAEFNQSAREELLARVGASMTDEELFEQFATAATWMKRKATTPAVRKLLGDRLAAARGALASGHGPLLMVLAGSRSIHALTDAEHQKLVAVDAARHAVDQGSTTYRWLSYVSNPAARMSVVKAIGVIVNGTDALRSFSDDMYKVREAVERRTSAHHHEVREPFEQITDVELLSWAVQRCMPYRDPDQYNKRTAADLPSVLANSHLSERMVATIASKWNQDTDVFMDEAIAAPLLAWLEKFPEVDSREFVPTHARWVSIGGRDGDERPPRPPAAQPDGLSQEQAEGYNSSYASVPAVAWLDANLPDTEAAWLLAFDLLGAEYHQGKFIGSLADLVAVVCTMTD